MHRLPGGGQLSASRVHCWEEAELLSDITDSGGHHLLHSLPRSAQQRYGTTLVGCSVSPRLTEYCRNDVSKVLWAIAYRNACIEDACDRYACQTLNESPSGPAALSALLVLIASSTSHSLMAGNGADSGYI